jgi:hypothetical protein
MTLLASELAEQNDGMLGAPLVGPDAYIMKSSMNVYYQTVLNVRYCNIILVEKKRLYYGFFLSNMSSRTGTHVISSEMGRTYGTIERQDRCIQGFGGET